ncbi:MAG: fatty acid CoA ligase family protein [Archangium sp.]|nr:fatty acid CoA ligase family protein [Archangium sp.]MDP3569712.1 fatty acid CoA ligase family protein [Archangium sp.]
MNACSLPRAFATTQPGVLALVDKKSGRSLSFEQFKQALDETSSALRLAGLKPGDRAALFVATGIEFVVLVNACFQAGVVPVLIDPGMGAKNVLSCVREQRPVGLIGIAKAHVLRLVFRSAFASVRIQVLVGGRFFPGAKSLDALKKEANGSEVHEPAADEVAAVLYTSGSTGAPKGVLYTHGMLAGQATAIRDMFHIQPGEVDVACFLPFGLFSVAMGMTAVFPDMDFRFPAKAKPEKIFEAMQGATSAFASPALWEPFSRYLAANKVELKGVKRILTAGAPVRPQLHERLLAQLPDGDVFTPYGATEALPVAFMNGRAVLAETAGLTRAGKGTCVGALAPDVAVKIIAITDEAISTLSESRELATGEIGEIIVRGPCVTRAYDDTHSERAKEANAKAKILDANAPEGFWHRMGDCGYFDAQGRLWFCGRKAHRVETKHGTLHSIPVEAVAEEGSFSRAAFVGLGERGQQVGVVIFEVAGEKPRLAPDWEAAMLTSLKAKIGSEGLHAALLHFGPLPVDRRHNAKLEREALAIWAAKQRPSLLSPKTPVPPSPRGGEGRGEG